MGLLENAAEWLESQRIRELSVPIVYQRRGGETLNIPATPGRTLFRAENEYGVTIRTETRDFLPERGDVILHAGLRYEVLAPNGEPVWRWSGTGRILRRIHTKEIGGA